MVRPDYTTWDSPIPVQSQRASGFHGLWAHFRQRFSGRGSEVVGFHVLGHQKDDQIDDTQVELLGKPTDVAPIMLPDVDGVVEGSAGLPLSTGVIDTVETRHNGARWGSGES